MELTLEALEHGLGNAAHAIGTRAIGTDVPIQYRRHPMPDRESIHSVPIDRLAQQIEHAGSGLAGERIRAAREQELHFRSEPEIAHRGIAHRGHARVGTTRSVTRRMAAAYTGTRIYRGCVR